MSLSDHIVKAYDDELNHLTFMIISMGKKVDLQLDRIIEALSEGDSEKAKKVIDHDPEIDHLEMDIDTYAVRLIALRQPLASDLRNVISALKISAHLERMADYVVNVAKRTCSLEEKPAPHYVTPIIRLIRTVQEMLRDILDAYVQRDDGAAHRVWEKDKEVDESYNGFVRELLTYMMEDPRNITPCIHFLFIAKNIERLGDHITNIAEHIHYLIHGTLWTENRHT